MEKNKKTILLIENNADFVGAFKRVLKNEHLTEEFVLEEVLTSGEDLIVDCVKKVVDVINRSDEIAIALVDIALNETTAPKGLHKGIDKSGHIVAEKLREILPHVPIVAITAHDKRSNVTVDVSFDPNFDGLVPKDKIINANDSFSKKLFFEIIEKANNNLRHYAKPLSLPQSFNKGENMNNERKSRLVISEDIYTSYQVEEVGRNSFDEILFNLFGDSEGTVKYFTPGFSGAILFEVETRFNSRNESSSPDLTNWILKLSKDKIKLKLELDNHKNLKTRGIFNYSYPTLLKEELFSLGQWHAMATEKQRDAKTLKEFLNSNPEVNKIEKALENEIEIFLKKLYGEPKLKSCLIWQQFYKLKNKDKVRILVNLDSNKDAFNFHLQDLTKKSMSSVRNFLFSNGESVKEINELRQDTVTFFIHGDFHSRNILINPQNLQITTIDFPNTEQGHCVKDFAKLETDIIFSVLDSNNSVDTLWASVSEWCPILETLERKDFFNVNNITVCNRLKDFHLVEIISTVRKSAKRMMPSLTCEEYLLSLLSYTLKLIPYPDITLPKKSFAVLYAGKILELLSDE